MAERGLQQREETTGSVRKESGSKAVWCFNGKIRAEGVRQAGRQPS